ncbi:MAG: hypothetical protein HY966_06785, partial [Ignavibacteriales bacterium]|nr:hypothetical protein [Ignavibacteriales bacterium]
MKLTRFFLSMLMAGGSVVPAIAQPVSSANKVTAEVKLSSDVVFTGGSVRAAVVLHIQDGWHINSHKPTFDYLIGTSLQLAQNAKAIISDIQYPEGKRLTLGFADQPLDVYDGSIKILFTLKLSDKLVAGNDSVVAFVTAQSCNDQVCLAPADIRATVPLTIVQQGTQAKSINQDFFASYKPAERAGQPVPKNDLADIFFERGSLVAFLAIFVIGLALNLTPCVYPMLSVTVSLFGSQTETNIVRIVLKAVVYVLGIASMYSALGVTAALGGGLFGGWLQNPWVLGSIAALLFGLALSSFGLYQIQMPYWLTSKLGGTTGTGLIATYLSGLVVGVFAAPCVGPPVIALMTLVGSKGDPVFGFWAFFTLALGLGFPYLILGTFSGLLKKIPRSGTWMVWVERIFGVVLTGAALFYFALALAPKIAQYVVPFTLVAGGAYLGFIEKSGRENKLLRRVQWA